MSLVKRSWAMNKLSPSIKLLSLPTLCALGLLILVLSADRFEREFRTNLEHGFQQRVELGDLASSLQQLRRALEFPRILDSGYIGFLTERIQEVDQKIKAQNLSGRVGDLSLPSKELAAIIAYKPGFERLAATAAQIERIHVLRLSVKAPDLNDNSAIKRVANLLEEYASAAAALRGSRGGQQSIGQLASASLGMGENLQAAIAETRRKAAPPMWRDVFNAFPSEPADFVDRLLADARLLDDFQSQRGRALGRLEQASAKIDSAERLLLGAKSDGGLLVIAMLLTWTGLGFGLLGLGWSALKLRQAMRSELPQASAVVEVVAPESVLAESEAIQNSTGSEEAERVIAARVAQAAGVSTQGLSTRGLATIAAESSVEALEADEVTSGYWIASGSMAERRVALLDKQSIQLEQHVKSVLAAAESLAGRADLMVQSLQLVREDQAQPGQVVEADTIRKRVDELQSLAINLSLRVASGEVHEPVLDDLEQFNRELESLASEVKMLGAKRSDATFERRVVATLDEGRRMIAAADTLKERTEILYEDAQRFRRHSEALIQGIQEGAVTEVPMRLVKDLRNID